MMILQIPQVVLDDARSYFESAGASGCEGTGMLAGKMTSEDVQTVTRFFAPDQIAAPVPGCWVEVTEKGKLQLAVSLKADELWVARIHSHPAHAFHSPTDDANPGLTAEGSWSIVVPFFGLGLRSGIDSCAVYRLSGTKWQRLDGAQVQMQVQLLES
ncbi:MAG TPA: hypothetical protein VGR71_08765 [Nitrospira sp.]|nr:hypothetical protein [Nitrospira sp.]